MTCDPDTRVCVELMCEEPEPESPLPPPPMAPTTSELRVRLRWSSGGDMDLHVINPIATRWQDGSDCYYGTCDAAGSLEWGIPGEPIRASGQPRDFSRR